MNRTTMNLLLKVSRSTGKCMYVYVYVYAYVSIYIIYVDICICIYDIYIPNNKWLQFINIAQYIK